MERHRYLWGLVGLLVLVSLACNAFAGQPLEPTLARPDLPGDGAGDVAELPTAVIQNIAPTATLRGDAPATAAPVVAEPVDGEPVLRALVDVNIRVGPGVAYARDNFLLKGETAVVLGRHAESGWWKIVCPERSDGNVCWVSGGSEYTSVSNGAAAQSVVAPPTPTAEPTVAATIAPTAVSELSEAAAATQTETLPDAREFGLAAESRLVYADEGALWLLTLDETDAAEPTWLADAEDVGDILISPNGRYAAYTNWDESFEVLYLVDLETSEQKKLVSTKDIHETFPEVEGGALWTYIGQFQWLIDSRTIAFNTGASNIEGFSDSHENLWTVTVDGESIQRFLPGEGGAVFEVSINDVIVFGNHTSVFRADLQGSSKEVMIEFPSVKTYSEFTFFPQIHWKADGSSAMAAIASEDSMDNPNAMIWDVPQSGVSTAQNTIDGRIVFDPVIWSQNDQKLGYVDSLYPTRIMVADADGDNVVSYAEDETSEFLSFLAWDQSSVHFVYSGEGYYAIGQLDEEPLLVEMAEGQTAVSAQWLNDNAFIIAIGSADNWDFRLQTAVGPATRLVSGSTTAIFDSWSP